MIHSGRGQAHADMKVELLQLALSKGYGGSEVQQLPRTAAFWKVHLHIRKTQPREAFIDDAKGRWIRQ
jgi:hypothetical protein